MKRSVMTHLSLRRVLVVCIMALATFVCARAQEQKDLIGKWNMVSETDGDPVKWTLELKEVDGKLSAFLVTEDGEAAAKDFTYSEGVLKFKAPYQGEDYDIELRAKDDKLEGTWSGGGTSGRTSGTKA